VKDRRGRRSANLPFPYRSPRSGSLFRTCCPNVVAGFMPNVTDFSPGVQALACRKPRKTGPPYGGKAALQNVSDIGVYACVRSGERVEERRLKPKGRSFSAGVQASAQRPQLFPWSAGFSLLERGKTGSVKAALQNVRALGLKPAATGLPAISCLSNTPFRCWTNWRGRQRGPPGRKRRIPHVRTCGIPPRQWIPRCQRPIPHFRTCGILPWPRLSTPR